jgi:hypothetical protein
MRNAQLKGHKGSKHPSTNSDPVRKPPHTNTNSTSKQASVFPLKANRSTTKDLRDNEEKEKQRILKNGKND